MLARVYRRTSVLRHCLYFGVPPPTSILPPAPTPSCSYQPAGSCSDTGIRSFSEQVVTQQNTSRAQKLKALVKEYGPLTMGLYLTIGFISIGACYAVISVGVNVEGILNYFGMEVSQKTAGFSTLAIAYLMHKMLLPLRIGLTIGGVPVIAKYLRRKGWMKPSPSKQTK